MGCPDGEGFGSPGRLDFGKPGVDQICALENCGHRVGRAAWRAGAEYPGDAIGHVRPVGGVFHSGEAALEGFAPAVAVDGRPGSKRIDEPPGEAGRNGAAAQRQQFQRLLRIGGPPADFDDERQHGEKRVLR